MFTEHPRLQSFQRSQISFAFNHRASHCDSGGINTLQECCRLEQECRFESGETRAGSVRSLNQAGLGLCEARFTLKAQWSASLDNPMGTVN